MKAQFKVTPRAVAEMRRAFHKTYIGGADAPYRAALAAALPFCKLNDEEAQYYATNRHGVRINPGEVIHERENGRLYTLQAVYRDVLHAYTESGELCELSPAEIPGLTIRRVGETGPRLRLFDGRFTLPLVVQSYPGVSFIHPADNVSAPVAVITCDDHATIAAAIVDAIRASMDTVEIKTTVNVTRDRISLSKEPVAVAEFRTKNAEAMRVIRAACGPDIDKSWAEKARELFGDQKRSTLLVIGSALAKIAEALPGRVHIEVGYPEPTCRDGMPDRKPDAWMRAEDSHLLAKGHVVTAYPHPGAFTEYLPVYLGTPPRPDPDFAGVKDEFADTSHMSGYTDKGVPRHGGTAMRQGWKIGANPWFRRDGALSWEAALWIAQWHFENAECMKSHIEGENFKPLPPVRSAQA